MNLAIVGALRGFGIAFTSPSDKVACHATGSLVGVAAAQLHAPSAQWGFGLPLLMGSGILVGWALRRRTELKRDQDSAALKPGSGEQYQLLFERNPVPMWVFDRGSLRFLAVNDAAVKQYGYSREEFLQMTAVQIRPGEEVAEFLADVEKRTTGLRQPGNWRHRRKDGSILEVEIASDTLKFEGADAILVAAYDITGRTRAETALRDSQERYRATFEDAVVGIFQSTQEQGLVSVNRALAHMLGYLSPKHMLRSVKDIGTQLFAEPEMFRKATQSLDREGLLRGYELQALCKDAARKWVLINLRAVRDASGEISFLEGMVEDITSRKAAEARVQFLAYHDPLTGLPNRVCVQDRIQHALARARPRNGKLALLLLDLDGFKTLNDSLGHTFGDLVLTKIAERLASCAGPQDTVARIGGDEFLVLLTDVGDRSEIADAANRILEVVKGEFAIRGQSVRLSSSIGISIFPDDGTDMEKLIQHADSAMYSAKEQRRNSFTFFSGEMHDQAVERLNLEKNLKLALERDEFFLLFQPQMNALTCQISGVEALLRWRQPELGLVPPGEFIQAAENSSLILQIGEWVLRAACRQARTWLDAGLLCGPLAVNVSALQFRQKDFTRIVRRVLAETGLPPQHLEFEITEGSILSNAEETRSVLGELKSMGLKLAIDDFGTGYCSLSYLKEFPVNKLKIDRSFIRGVAVDADDAAITTAIIHMAHSLNLEVTAEGVENEAQLAFLRENRCDSIQGFYFSSPLDEAAFEHVLRSPIKSATCA
jgi:diguanylate cyclase (GGDEF)-like protein/PAS domain S-box-containing protein